MLLSKGLLALAPCVLAEMASCPALVLPAKQTGLATDGRTSALPLVTAETGKTLRRGVRVPNVVGVLVPEVGRPQVEVGAEVPVAGKVRLRPSSGTAASLAPSLADSRM